LERILSSAVFSRNERLSRFLRFVVEQRLAGKEGELKESVIAIEVCRKRDYDSKLDSIVRTEAGRLRARLAEYYVHEGSGDPVIIEMPKGGYTPVFRQPEAAPDSDGRVQMGPRSRLGKGHCLIAGLAGLAVATTPASKETAGAAEDQRRKDTQIEPSSQVAQPATHLIN
jgi:hypothetical protein